MAQEREKSLNFSLLSKILCVPFDESRGQSGGTARRRIPQTNRPEFCIHGYYEIPRAERENGILCTQTLAAVDVSNVMHHGVQSKQKYFSFVHSRRLGEVCVDYIMRMAKSRGITSLQLHIDDPTRVPAQKSWEQRKRDILRKGYAESTTDTEATQGNSSAYDGSRTMLHIGEKVPDDWEEKVLGNRRLKPVWGNLLVASTARRCAANLLESKNSEIEFTVHGANIMFSDRILLEGISDAEKIEEASLPSSASMLHFDDEDPKATGNRIRDKKLERTKCWSIRLRSCTNPTCGSTALGDKVFIRHKPELDSEHGESETRMQYTLAKEMKIRKEIIPEEKTTVVQFSKGSDNTCLAMLAKHKYGLKKARDVYIKMDEKYFDICKLLNAVHTAGLDAVSIARLYSLSVNYSQPACAVANSQALIRTYRHNFEAIGDLRTEESVQSLFYHTFACSINQRYSPELLSSLKVPQPDIPYVMTEKWKQAVRYYVFFNSKCVSTLLPQDEDLLLTHRRGNLFLINAYWLESSVLKKLTDLPVGINVGTNDLGDPLLEMPESIEGRKKVIKYRAAKCRCGKSNPNKLCCSPGSQCGCVKGNRLCMSKCACASNRCSNIPGGVEAARERMESALIWEQLEAQRRRQEAPSALHRILNEEDFEPQTSEKDKDIQSMETDNDTEKSSENDQTDDMEDLSLYSSSDCSTDNEEEVFAPLDDLIQVVLPGRGTESA